MLHIITGPPCSGKSTYVREHAQPGDVRVDFDLIAQALGADVAHGSDGAIRDCAFKARNAVVRHLLEHADEVEAYIIHSDPADWQVEEYEKVGAEFVDLDTDLETCLERAEQDERPDGEADAIRDWFARHEKGNNMPMTKRIDAKATVDSNGQITGYAATFTREPDWVNDVIAKGAFADWLDHVHEDGVTVPLLYNHDQSLDSFIGRVIDIREDDHGLLFTAEFDGTEKAQRARELAMDGRLAKFSFAYMILDQGTVTLPDGRKANELRKLDVDEVSLVLSPCNPDTSVVDVKSGQPEVKSGRRNSKADEDELRRILDLANTIAASVQSLIGDEQDEPDQPEDKPEEPAGAKGEDSTAMAALEALKDEAIRLLDTK